MPITPNYQRVYEDIARRIQSGELPPGAQLPSMRDLKEQYGVGNTAVRTALLLLKERGYVEGHQGKGVYVTGGEKT